MLREQTDAAANEGDIRIFVQPNGRVELAIPGLNYQVIAEAEKLSILEAIIEELDDFLTKIVMSQT